MPTRRVAPNQVSTDISLEVAREMCWRALAGAGMADVVIDRDKNVVAASKSASLRSNGVAYVVKFEENSEETRLTVTSKALLGGIDLGMKKRVKKMADTIERSFISTPQPPPLSAFSPPRSVAPIAAPTSESSYVTSSPVYGVAMPPKRGTIIMVNAILGLVLIHILSPASWIYANRTLKDYGDVDPGDKKTVKAARIVGIIGTFVLVGIWVIEIAVANR